MSQLTCLACQLPIYRGQRAISLEFGVVEQSEKSGRDVIKGYATDKIHFGCIHTYMSRINNEVYDSIREFDRKEIRKQVVAELRDELKQEVYDEVTDEMRTMCAVCQSELDDEEEDLDPVVQSAIVRGENPDDQPTPLPPTPLPPSPFGFVPFGIK